MVESASTTSATLVVELDKSSSEEEVVLAVGSEVVVELGSASEVVELVCESSVVTVDVVLITT